MAEPEDFPTYPDASVTDITWAEGGSAVEPSSGRKGTGEIPGDIYTSDEHNWLFQIGYQFLRAAWARGVRPSDAFFGSWFVPNGNGVWSTDAVGALQAFLSDAPTGVNSLVADMYLDPNNVGAVRVQVSIPKGTPVTFVATRDTYVFVPIDLLAPPIAVQADLQFIDVPVGDPAPATPAGYVPVWRVETDGLTVVDQEILLFQVPILKAIGAESIGVGDLNVGGMLTVAGDAEFASAVEVTGMVTLLNDLIATSGDANLGNTFVAALEATGTVSLFDNVLLGTGVGNKVIQVGADALDSMNVFAAAAFNSLATFVGGLTANCDVDIGTGAGNFTLTVGNNASDTMVANGTITLNANINGGASQDITAGRHGFVIGAAAPVAYQIAAGTGGLLSYNDGALKLMHYSTNGWVYATGDQEAVTGLAATQTVATTTQTVTALGLGNVRVRVIGQAQVAALGSTITINVQHDQGGFTNIGAGQVVTALKNTADANDWQLFFHERVFSAGTVTATLYRANITAQGGTTVRLREVRLSVFNERA